MKHLPPLKAVRAFEACYRLGSFTRAARELNVGQPAISHQIRLLEQDLGAKLFTKHGAVPLPTGEADIYYRDVVQTLGDLERASIRMRHRQESGALTIATYPGIAAFWLLPRLARMKNKAQPRATRSSVLTGVPARSDAWKARSRWATASRGADSDIACWPARAE